MLHRPTIKYVFRRQSKVFIKEKSKTASPRQPAASQCVGTLVFTLLPGKWLISSSGKSVCVAEVVVCLGAAALLLFVVLTCT